MSIIKIGRRELDTETLQQAIKDSKRWSEVCDNLGWNSTVRTTVTAIREKSKELGLDTSNIIYNYTKDEGYDESVKSRMKTFNIVEINKGYYDAIEAKKNSEKENSFITYKPSVGAFLEFIGEKDFSTVTVEEIETYVKNKEGSESTKKNCMAHIRSMMLTAVKENVNDAVEKVSKNMLIWLI